MLKPAAKQFPIKVPDFVGAPKWTLEPSEEFTALWGTGYDKARAFIEIEHRRKIIKSFWTEAGATQQSVKQAVTEAMRGGFTLRVTMVRENRAYLDSHRVDVPWSNKNLTVKWEHFVSKLEPAQKETWTAIITGPDAKKAVAEMVAALVRPIAGRLSAAQLAEGVSTCSARTTRCVRSAIRELRCGICSRCSAIGRWITNRSKSRIVIFRYDIVSPFNMYYGFGGMRGMQMAKGMREMNGAMDGAAMPAAPMAANAAMAGEDRQSLRRSEQLGADKVDGKPGAGAGRIARAAAPPGPDLSNVSARQNLNETAFFFPHLMSDDDGRVKMEFTMPEALTKWKFLGFAHDKELRSGYSGRQGRDGERPDGPAEPAALRSRRRCDRVHRQSVEPIADEANRRGPADARRRPDGEIGRRRARQHRAPINNSTSRPRNRKTSPGS